LASYSQWKTLAWSNVSVQHVSFHKPKKVKISEANEVDSSEAHIYAISSEGGNIIYLVNTDGKKISGTNINTIKLHKENKREGIKSDMQ
jgi:hypothetical protein